MRDLPCGPYRVFLEFEVRRVDCTRCLAVKREALDFLSDSPFYTKRFAYYVGRRCRNETIAAVAKELHMDWDSVKTLDMQYMKAQLAKAGTPGPIRIGIDEISIRKRHTYRIVVSDLDRKRPIWFGGEGRSEADMARFYAELGPKKASRIRLALMDMWNRSAMPPMRMRHRPPSSSTNSMSCVTSATRSTRCARPSTRA